MTHHVTARNFVESGGVEVSLPRSEKTVRSLAVDLMVIDEAAR